MEQYANDKNPGEGSVGRSPPLKLKHFRHLYVQWKSQICLLF